MKLSFKIYLIVGILILVSVLAAWHFHSEPVMYNESFEQDFGGWIENADAPPDPNNPGRYVAWNVSRVMYPAHSGQYSLSLYVDGRQDDGLVWVEKKILVKKNSQIQIKVSFEFYSEQESFNVIASVCAYAGISTPEVEADFAVLGQANEVAGWKNYVYETILQASYSGEIWVAVGITVRWETEMTYNIDDVTVTIS
jgi:hypothetical protein